MRVSLLIILVVLISCGRQPETNTPTQNSERTENSINPQVALDFINDYALFCTPGSKLTNDTNWIRNHVLLTEDFKKTYYNLMDSSRKADPELGLGFDPVFDAQDYPDKGFEFAGVDIENGFVTIKGKDQPEFMLVLKVAEKDGRSLVDGAGVINVPVNKRAKR